MIATLRKMGYPFVMIFTFGDQLMVAIITTDDIQVKAVSLNQFMDVYSEIRQIIKENNQKIEGDEKISKDKWWLIRKTLDCRLGTNIKSLSRIPNFNFFDDIYS